MGEGLRFLDTSVKRGTAGWLVSVPTEDGGALEYVYPTRKRARYIAAVFRMGPTWFPPPHRLRRNPDHL